MINKTIIDNEIKELNEIKMQTQSKLEKLRTKVPKGCTLRAVRHSGSNQFFVRKNSKEMNGTYIKKKDRSYAKLLAQIEYDENLIKVLSEEIEELSKLQSVPAINPYITATNQIIDLKRELLTVPYISDEEYVNSWLQQDYEKLGFKENFNEYYTKKGLRVRSKSEIIIADTLDEYEIPYLYEKPIRLADGKTFHPDFTFLNVNTRKEIIWEHFGMMDDIEYRNNAFSKIREYEINGYYQGINFMWTFETCKYPINTRSLNDIIREIKQHIQITE